jgi:hypothetical protein
MQGHQEGLQDGSEDADNFFYLDAATADQGGQN